MKYKIIERYDGQFDIYKKINWHTGWSDTFYGPLKTIEEAREWINRRINDHKLKLLEEKGRKHKRVIEIIGD